MSRVAPARRVAVALLASAAALSASHASAYCRATTCKDGTLCTPAEETDCGVPLAWKRPCVGVSVQQDGSNQLDAAEAHASMLEAFATWGAADCGDGLHPGLFAFDLAYVACDEVEYNSTAGNANVLLFRDGHWPHKTGPHNIALTTVTFDTQTGEIYDADIELNTATFTLTLGEVTDEYDLLSVLTHEAGHFLGLAHSTEPGATMTAVYSAGDLDFRTLSSDDAAAICAAYPPADALETCDPIPRHGFSPECAATQTEGTCAAAPGAPPRGVAPFAAALAGIAALLGRRSLRTRRARPRS